MASLLATVFIASLIGSLHCAGMCGVFACMSCESRLGLAPAYHAGRLVTYLILGTVAGLIGAALNLGASTVGLQQVAAVAAGLVMIAAGSIALLRMMGVKLPRMPIPNWVQRSLQAGHRRAQQLKPVTRAFWIGGLSTLLPCGWLYVFVLASAATGHPVWGAATMFAFWLGTVPILFGLQIGASTIMQKLRQKASLITACLVVLLGLFTATGRATIDIRAASGHVDVTGSVDSAGQAIKQLDQESLPCCQNHAD